MAARVTYLGEVTGDNMAVTPAQLLDLLRADLETNPQKGGVARPVMGLYAIIVREDADGGLQLDHYRSQLPKFVELAVVSRALHTLVAG